MNSTTLRRGAALAAALTLSLGTAACSKGDEAAPAATAAAAEAATTTATPEAPSAVEIFDAMKANTKAAKSGALKGFMEADGERIDIEFAGTEDGKTSDLTMTLGDAGTAHLIVTGGEAYIQADKTFWTTQGGAEIADVVGDKYLTVPTQDFKELLDQFTIKTLSDEMFAEVTSDDVDEKVGEETVDGVDCWVLTENGDAEEGAVYVAKDDLTLVRFTAPAPDPMTLDFSDWDEKLDIKAPEAKDIADLG